MGPIEALKIALEKEIEARDMYEKMGQEHPATKDICIYLQNEEEKHKLIIEKKISELSR